jgi:nucleoside-diphosphate-sugar epimerase
MTLNGATAFVTGGTGFIGGRLIEVLTAQYGMTVRAVMRNNNSGPGAYRAAGCGATLVQGNITDEAAMIEAIKGCDYVFHCAFGTSGDVKADRHVIVNGAKALARAAAVNKVRHFVNLSTMVVFGDTPAVVDETFTPTKMWNWPYPHDKLAAEGVMLAENARSKLPITTLRLGSIYGPWGPAFTYYPIACLTNGRVVLVDEGRGVSNAAYIDDVIQAMILAATRVGDQPEMFIIRGPDRVTWRQFYDAYEAMLGTDSLVCMTPGEIRSHDRRAQMAAIRGALPQAIGILKRDPTFKALASRLPLIKSGWKFYRRYINRPSPIATLPKTTPEAGDQRPLHVLPEMMRGYYASTTDYRIDHARNVLGYEPAFDLDRGMAMTQAWAKWAGLIRANEG